MEGNVAQCEKSYPWITNMDWGLQNVHNIWAFSYKMSVIPKNLQQ